MYYKDLKKKKCSICGNEFGTFDVRKKYCGFKCAKEARNKNLDKRRKKYERQNVLKFGIKEKDKSVLTFKCGCCGAKYSRYKSQVKYRGTGYCSIECRVDSMKNKDIKKKRIDDLWSEVVKLVDGGKCLYCGKDSYLNSHHIFSRTNKSTRWYLPNGITLCAGHHVLSSTFSAHKTPAEFVEWIKEKRGIEWYEDLRRQAKGIHKWTKSDEKDVYYNLLDLKEHLSKELLEELKCEK